jgi:ribonuclease E
MTTLHATGEMHSESPVATFTPEPAAETVSPILHENVIANPEENTIEDGAVLPHFAPGAGVLEEETLDEEDYNTTLHASSIEEMDDFEEEETLEGAADLGSMIREMSIDQITRSGNVEEEEDDLEEEDAVHDPLHDDLDESDDEDEDEDLDESDTEEDVLHEEVSEDGEVTRTDGADHAQNGIATSSPDRSRDQGRGRGRRDGRRGDRFGRNSGDRSERPRNTGGAGDRERSGNGGRDRRGGRSSMQSTNLPAISELLKPGQEILVQIAKEPIAKKGARITSHIALPGRFLVFMPTVNHTGVSRKIESDGERRRLKEILLSEKGEASGGFIVRTAASGASEEELRSDLRFLLNLWADIKQRSESSKSPALIYHDLNLVERILRDQVTDNFSAIWVDTETEYERVLRFLQRFQPSLIRRVKLYTKETPLFEQFGITEEINKALRSKVWLKSGGSIVINQTEALVAIDINTGKFVGKTARLEDTIVKTNLDAIPEIVRQIRLRDLGGIIIIDFIDMDERKNRNKVMAALEEELKSDRAPSKVLQFNDFGLVAITRKRVKQSLERTLSTTCNVCTGTGMVKSPVTVCNDIYVEMRKMHKHLDRGDVMLRVHPEVVKQLKTTGGKWLQEMEEMVGKTILVKSDPSLHPEQFDIH